MKKMGLKVFFIIAALCFVSVSGLALNHVITLQTTNTNVDLDLSISHTIDTDWATGWTFSEPASTDVSVLSSYGGQSSVLFFNDDSTASDGFCAAIHSFGQDRNNGSITFYIQLSATDLMFEFVLQSDGSDSEQLVTRITGKWATFYSSTYNDLDIDTTYSASTWIKVKYEWDCTSQQVSVYIDDALKSTDPFQTTDPHMDGIKIRTGHAAAGGKTGDHYIAWMDYSWVTESGGGTTPPIPGFEIFYIGIGLVAMVGIIMLAKRKQALIN